MATKIGLFNGALIELGENILSDTGENVVSGRMLNQVYSGVVEECLAAGSWNFAMETIKAAADTGIEPEFGFTEVFAKPSDWVRTHAVSEDEYFNFPLTAYYDDASFWSADNSPIYVRYVSNDTGLGLELTRWTQNFTRYVELELADRVSHKLTSDQGLRDTITKRRDKAKTTALNYDAMNEPQPKFAPASSWTRARSGRSGGQRDRGSRSSLTG